MIIDIEVDILSVIPGDIMWRNWYNRITERIGNFYRDVSMVVISQTKFAVDALKFL